MNETFKKSSRLLYWSMLFLGLGLGLCVFLIFTDSFGEEQMITFSYPVTFLTAAGIAGLSTKNTNRAFKNSLVWGFGALACLFIFYVQVFPSL
ncbi:MAG TPA: hypothetical protein VD905_04465 [Flavobacteriales bacterium]|nr:hypothetical protein [Flavobacteriales bacterium]